MPSSPDIKNTSAKPCEISIRVDSADQSYQPFPYLDLSPNPELVSQGWDRRFMVGPDRVEETNELYRELGFEVLNEPILPSEFNEICKVCQTLACSDYVVVYTRKGTGSNSK